ncbi:MAG: T9SS C-terminal target domain-containing protein [Flavobacteriia bacterium]|nr:MAG: T9SS C-terminal target domain-containing protein [Flavobacteriia bacterium]
MSKQLFRVRQKIFFVLILASFLLLGSAKGYSQTNSGIAISWDKEVGCQTYNYDDRKKVFIEDIGESDCIRMCEQSVVHYTLTNLPAGATTTWSVGGGTLSNATNTVCTVSWGAVGTGSVSFTIVSGSTILSKTLCIEKIVIPSALFEIAPLHQYTPDDNIYLCRDQVINFINLSSANNGTSLISYHWVFKNNTTGTFTTSSEFQPSVAFTEDGEYKAILTVTNACNCTSEYVLKFKVKGRGFEISCPTVICEGQSSIYSLPFDGMDICHEHFNWTVNGGRVISEGGGNIEVLWNAVDSNGFGYVTFYPMDCRLDCLEPSTIKVPVIQTQGTIQGPTDICYKGQGRYKLPQWPTTDIQWEIVGNVNNDLGEIILTDQRNEVIVTPYTMGTITLRATYINTLLHCGGEAELEILISRPLEITGEQFVCQNNSSVYTTNDGIPVQWNLRTNTGVTIYSASNSTTFSYTFNQSGSYILTATGAGYCAGEQKIITVIAKPLVPKGVNGILEVCPNSVYTYTVQNPNLSNDYYWEVTNGSIVGANTGNQVNVTFTGAFPATIKVYQKTISPISCMSDPKIITINQISVNAQISSNFTAICANSIASYQALKTGTSNLHTDGDTYTWSFANASNGLVASTLGSISNGQGTNSVDVTWNNVTAVTTVDLILTIGKCTITPAPQFVKQITLYPKTEIVITASNNPVCAGSLYPVTFTISSINGVPLSATDQVTWNFGSGAYTTAPGVFTQTTTFNNNSTTNIGQVVTAFIANANGCGQTNTSSVTVTVLPNPPAIATLTSQYNAFCTTAEINATITVSSNTTGVTFQWYKNGVALSPAQTGTSLNVTPAMGFGYYTFRVTNSNGCIRESNGINISQVCPDIEPCTITDTISNTSYLSACGQITFQGTATGTPLSEEWIVLGSGSGNYTINGTVLTGEPGNYKIVYKVYYPCEEGGPGYLISIKDVVIPYKPDFSYVVECANNNSFNVNFIDNSNFYAPVASQTVRFYYKLSGAATFTGPVSYDPSLGVFEIQNLPAGNYIFKQEVEGTYPGTPTIVCSKVYTVNLQGVNPFLNIIVNNNQSIKCHNTSVKFDLSILLEDGSTVLWNFGDGASNTLTSPDRVFGIPDTTYNVTCTVTNPYGCSRILTAQVYIPKECFFGDIVALPSNATVCQGQSVTLTYIPNNDNCSVANYVWMKGNQPVIGAPNSNLLTVSTSDFYWVKVKSINECEYNSPTQIKPVFNGLPTLKLLGNTTFCENEDVVMKVNTNATDIKWYVNNNLYAAFNNLTEAVFTGLASGNHTVTVVVTSVNGCTNTATQLINVQEAIHHIDFNVQIECEPYYRVTITATASNGSGIIYNWSNGDTGATIVVPDGGPYKVTATLGGCSISAQIDVPKNPENYIWIFPTGCYTDCSSETNYLIGPNLPLNEWSWNMDAQSDAHGSESFADTYTLIKDGDYTLTINTGACSLESEPLHYSTTKCDKCKIERFEIKEIKQNETPYCSYTYTLVIYSNMTVPYQVTLSEDTNQVLLLPSSFTLNPGQNVIQVTVIPQSPFTGGVLTWNLQGTVPYKDGYELCVSKFEADIPWCNSSSKMNNESEDKILSTNSFSMYPNPAATQVTLVYTMELEGATLEIYDLTGRSIAKKALSLTDREVTLAVDSYPAGMYMLVVKQADTILWQNKLIIK